MNAKAPGDMGSFIVPSAVLTSDGVCQNTVMTFCVTVRHLPDGRTRLGIDSPNENAAILLTLDQARHVATLLTAH